LRSPSLLMTKQRAGQTKIIWLNNLVMYKIKT
jgi:hypothetical protein